MHTGERDNDFVVGGLHRSTSTPYFLDKAISKVYWRCWLSICHRGDYLLFGSLSGLTMLGFLLDHGCTGGAVDEYLGLLVGCDYGKVLLAVGQACGI